MTTPITAICQKRGCKWFRGYQDGTLKPVCMAFPQGIPEQILSGKNMHDKNMSADGGYKYTPKK